MSQISTFIKNQQFLFYIIHIYLYFMFPVLKVPLINTNYWRMSVADPEKLELFF